MKKLFFCLISISFLLIACEKENVTDITDRCLFHDDLLGTCFYGISSYANEEIIIKDNEAYQVFEDSIRIHPLNTNCDTASLTPIDFNVFTLLAKKTSGGGCSVIYDRKVLKDSENKKIIYKIKVQYEGPCDMLISSWNWVYIPKLEEGYSVEFQVE